MDNQSSPAGSIMALITATELEACWPLTGVSVAGTINGYPGQDVLEVHSDQGTFAVKVAVAPLPPWHGDLYVLDYLAARRFPHAPRLLRTRDGHRVARSGDRVACVMDWVPRTAGHGLSPASMWAQTGEAAARLNACDDFPAPFAIPVAAALDELAAKARGQAFEREYLALLERLLHLARLEPQALIHGEIHPANARQDYDGTIILIDWEMAGSAHPALEYGYPLLLCFISAEDHTVDQDSATAFYDAYASTGAGIDPGLAFDAALFHALRHMWWRATVQRWNRIQFALENEAAIRDLVR